MNYSRSYFRALLREQVIAFKKRNKNFKPKRPPKPRHPKEIQREYTQDLNGIVHFTRQIYRAQVYPKLPKIVSEAQASRPKSDVKDRYLKDDYAREVDEVMDKVKIEYQTVYSKPRLKAMTGKIGAKVNQYSKKQTQEQVKAVIGIDLFTPDPWLESQMSAFVKENVGLISKWSDAQHAQSEEIIMRGARMGRRAEDIEKDLEDRIDVMGSRYDMIARDQVSKFNADLNMQRQNDLGVNKYIWSGTMDERERPMHRDLEGKVFSYDDPPVTNPQGDKNNPGGDYLCRCVALPYFGDILEGIEEEI